MFRAHAVVPKHQDGHPHQQVEVGRVVVDYEDLTAHPCNSPFPEDPTGSPRRPRISSNL